MARGRGEKFPLWCWWLLATVVSGLYAILCLVTFVDMAEIQYDKTMDNYPGSQLNGCMAGTLMSFILVALLGIVSFLILVKKTWSESGTGFSYGFLDAAYLFMAFFSLLIGVTLTAAKPWTNQWERESTFWPSSATNAFVATYIFAFITTAVFLLTFLALILYRRAVQRNELTIGELEARLRTSQMSDLAAAPASPGGGGVPASRSAPGGAWNV